MKTYSAKPREVEAKWYLIDADKMTLGRLASTIAVILRGKHKPEFTPHVDMGDFVIVINVDKIQVTGSKANGKTNGKVYYHHTGYPSGLRSMSYRDMMEKHPTRALEKAVKGMLPHNTLGGQQFNKLKLYAGSEHPHEAQQPLEFKELEVIR